MDPEIEVTSATEAPQIESASATEGRPLLFKNSSGCIFHASAQIRFSRESDFEPKLVSIGPYHHGRKSLKDMENIKYQCMSDILKLRPVRGSNIDRVPVEPFMGFERHARRFYKEKFDLSDVEFVEMLVLDSCFVIRIMLALSRNLPVLDLNMKMVVSDLLLLENQIPLFFIEQVCSWLYPKSFDDLLRDTFMQLDLPWWINFDRWPRLPINSDHLLHLYWKISEESIKKQIKEDHADLNQRKEDHADPKQRMINWAEKIRRGHRRDPPQKLIVNATELHQMARISFENVELYGGCVEFSKGIMRMPCLKIDSSQMTLLVNLVAFENSMFLSRRTISTYIKIMDDLIDSGKDVELLQKFGVVYNTLRSHTEAATFFNNIGNVCSIDNKVNPFSNLFENVNKHYNSCLYRSWANLRQNYFNSPWSGISVLAGVTLLFLAGAQTYYTVFPKK